MAIVLPGHCTPTEQWLAIFSSAFHTCVPTSLAFLSTALGTCSIISWLFAQLPQIYKNYTLKSASGLSIYFLAEWLLGDLTNLLGALLTDQATWQVIVAAYYVTVDICLVAQYIWYVHAEPWRRARLVGYDSDFQGHHPGPLLEGISPTSSDNSSAAKPAKAKKEETTPRKAPTPRLDAKSSSSHGPSLSEKALTINHKTTRPINQQYLASYPRVITLMTLVCVAVTTASPIQRPDTMLTVRTATPAAPSTAQFTGRIFSWISTFLYLFSRLPQIYKNFRRRSTSGLSPTLFIAAFFGNLFYSTSILTNPLAWSSYPPYGLHGWVGEEGSDRWTWVKLAVPFWLGAAGVLIMDAIIGVQFLVYGEGVELEVLEEERDGSGSWRRVKGWMRGWAPSPSPGSRREVEAVRDEERPLVNRRRIGGDRGEGYGAT